MGSAASAGHGLGTRLRRYPLSWRALGWLAAFRFEQAGWVACRGLPLPRVRNLGGGRVTVGNCLFYEGVRLEVGNAARLSIGTGTFLNRNVEIVSWGEVSIGRDCAIGWDVIILDTDQHPERGRGWDIRPVRIGDRVWIGARAIILKGVVIGDDAIVGAGAIVTHDVPAGAVVVGASARAIERRTSNPSGSSEAGGQRHQDDASPRSARERS